MVSTGNERNTQMAIESDSVEVMMVVGDLEAVAVIPVVAEILVGVVSGVAVASVAVLPVVALALEAVLADAVVIPVDGADSIPRPCFLASIAMAME